MDLKWIFSHPKQILIQFLKFFYYTHCDRIISLDWKQQVSQMQFKSKIVFLLAEYKFVIGKAVIPQEIIYA